MSDRRGKDRDMPGQPTPTEANLRPLAATVFCACAAAVLSIGSPAAAQQYGGGYGNQDFETPEYHVVNDGDTLWDISGQYYGDTYEWPRVWSHNAHITNPHWIYPGDVVYLKEQTGGDQDEAARQAQRDDGFVIRDNSGLKPGLRLPTVGFVTEKTPEFVGRIVASPKEARLLGEYDSVWVGFGDQAHSGKMRKIATRDQRFFEVQDPGEIEKKDRFAIVRATGPLENEEGDVVGQKYLVLGTLLITKTSEDNLQTAYIDRSWREIARGDYLIPYERQLKVIQHTEADRDLVAKILGNLRGQFDFGESHYVYINKGADDGVKIGNRMYIYQRETGLPSEWRDKPDGIPWRRVGRVRIVNTTEKFAIGFITDSKREIAVGDRLEMYEGN